MIYIIGPTEHQLFENTDLLTTVDKQSATKGADIRAKLCAAMQPDATAEQKAAADRILESQEHYRRWDQHDRGIFIPVLGTSVYGVHKEQSLEQVRQLADRFYVDDKRYPVRGEQITEDNYRYVLADITVTTSMAFSRHPSAPSIGFLSKENEPIEFKAERSMYPKPTEEERKWLIQPEKKLPLLKRILRVLNKSWFADEAKECADFNEARKEALKNYNERYNAFQGHLDAMSAASRDLKTALTEKVSDTKQLGQEAQKAAPTKTAPQLEEPNMEELNKAEPQADENTLEELNDEKDADREKTNIGFNDLLTEEGISSNKENAKHGEHNKEKQAPAAEL